MLKLSIVNVLYRTDDKWKAVRTALTPSFTTGKLKLMGETMQEVAEDCIKNLNKQLGKEDSIAMNSKR